MRKFVQPFLAAFAFATMVSSAGAQISLAPPPATPGTQPTPGSVAAAVVYAECLVDGVWAPCRTGVSAISYSIQNSSVASIVGYRANGRLDALPPPLEGRIANVAVGDTEYTRGGPANLYSVTTGSTSLRYSASLKRYEFPGGPACTIGREVSVTVGGPNTPQPVTVSGAKQATNPGCGGTVSGIPSDVRLKAGYGFAPAAQPTLVAPTATQAIPPTSTQPVATATPASDTYSCYRTTGPGGAFALTCVPR